MKKFYCFRCQQDVVPYKIFKWRFCPHCYRRITDNGEGFHRICNNCGAEMPPDADYCLKCGEVFNRELIKKRHFSNFINDASWFDTFLGLIFILVCLIILACIFYISIYALIIFIVVSFIIMAYNVIRSRWFL